MRKAKATFFSQIALEKPTTDRKEKTILSAQLGTHHWQTGFYANSEYLKGTAGI